MYAEKSVKAITSQNKPTFINLIEKRYNEMEKDSQKKRLDKVLKSIMTQ